MTHEQGGPGPAGAHAPTAPGPGRTAFVLGGGGHLGAYEVGMLRALLEAGHHPDIILGTSVGAINGAVLAADPATAVEKLERLWAGLGETSVFEDSFITRLGTAMRSQTHIHTNTALRRTLERELPVKLIEDLTVPYQCVAASIERATEHWFTHGPIIEAVLASSAIPGLLPPVAIEGEHYLDGGLVNSIPIGRALSQGATKIFVLHVGRLEQPLQAPRRPWEVAAVAFEIARRHRFTREIANLPETVSVHILPTGTTPNGTATWKQYVRYRDFSRTSARIEQAYHASAAFLAEP